MKCVLLVDKFLQEIFKNGNVGHSPLLCARCLARDYVVVVVVASSAAVARHKMTGSKGIYDVGTASRCA